MRRALFALALLACIGSFACIGSSAIGPPTFTSRPIGAVQPLERYNYTPTCSDSGSSLAMSTDAGWLVLFNGTITGRPIAEDIGIYVVNLTFSNSTEVAYQNYSLDVRWTRTSTPAMQADLLLALVFGFGLIAISVVDRQRPIWATYAGFIWITLSVVVLFGFGLEWFVIGLGIGFILMFEGTKAYAAGRQGA